MTQPETPKERLLRLHDAVIVAETNWENARLLGTTAERSRAGVKSNEARDAFLYYVSSLFPERTEGEDVWHHLKRGSTYTVVGTGEVQSSNLEEGEIVQIYRAIADGHLHVRRFSEFHDGHFVKEPSAIAALSPPARDTMERGRVASALRRARSVCAGASHKHVYVPDQTLLDEIDGALAQLDREAAPLPVSPEKDEES